MFFDFHFIYPFWLLTLIPIFWLFFLLKNQQQAKSQWSKLIAPNLLPYLIDKPEDKQQLRPYRLLVVSLVLATLALAGPTWRREPSPFSEDEAPLVIAIDLSSSMLVQDIQPSRLERGKQKIRDLLAQRSSGRTALVAYAGSAHLVMPLTEDKHIIETYLADLSTEIMPLLGDAPDLALKIAEATLSKTSIPGSILFVTDGISIDRTEAFSEYRQQSKNDVVVLAIGTVAGGNIPNADVTASETYSRLDRQGLDALKRQAGVYVTEVTADTTDIRYLNRHIQSHLNSVQEEQSDRWRNEGHWLLYPLAVLMLFWFRRGWTIQWLTVFLLGYFLFTQSAIATPLQRSMLPSSLPSHFVNLPNSFLNLWLTPDQQGRWLLERGRYGEAAERFEDPLWKGLVYYLDENFEAATEQLVQVTPKTPEVYFDIANAYAQQEDYKNALKYYDRALGMNVNYEDALANRELVEARLEKEEELAKQRPEEQEGDLKADKVVEDETPPPERKNEHPRPNRDDFGTVGMTDLWLQNVQTTPADFLRQKFRYQLDSTMNNE